MIKNITPGPGIYIAANNHSTPYIDMSRHSAGMVRYNGSNFEIYDGSSWMIMQSSYPQVELDGPTQEAVQWARRKMEQEKRLTELAKKHPAVADALSAVSHAQEQLDIVTALVDVK
jgi:hypothetical protein